MYFNQYVEDSHKKFTTNNFEQFFKNTCWDPEFFIYLNKVYNEFISRTYASWSTLCILPEYKELKLLSDEAKEDSNYYRHVRNEPPSGSNQKTYSIWQADHEKKRYVKVTAPYPVIGPTKKYTTYDRIDFSKTPHRYPRTLVKTFKLDTLAVADLLLHKEREPSVCVLSMAHPAKPGGAWRKGLFGQEESLYVRTTLFCGADKLFYPLDPYDSVFLKDVVVIRGSEEYGYPFLPKEERYTVDVISISGLKLNNRDASMDSDNVDTVRLKVRSMFLACIENDVRNLVLGALGCGLFKNDPSVVAKIFKAELQVFAGFFHKVYFSILGDDRAKFNKLLVGENDERIYSPRIDWFRENVVPTLGPLVSCEKGRMCTDNSPEHLKSCYHLPMCYNKDDCKLKDKVHRMCFRHKEECPYKAFCNLFEDETHNKYFKHENFKLCPEGADCTSRSPGHLSNYLHYPICPHGTECKRGEECSGKKRHLDRCQEGTRCAQFGDKEHYAGLYHPFIQPCIYDVTGRLCAGKGEDHFTNYSHLCGNGPYCSEIDNQGHCLHNIHAFQMCTAGDKCTDLSEAHLSVFWHPGQPVIREKCKGNCKDFGRAHRLECIHPAERFSHSGISMINVRDPTLEKFKFKHDYIYNDSLHPYFSTNVNNWFYALYNHIRNLGIDPVKFMNETNFLEIKAWFDSLLPTHMCSGAVLKSVLKLWSLNSLKKLHDLWTSRDSLIEIAFTIGIGKEICSNSHKNGTKYGKRYLRINQCDRAKEMIKEVQSRIVETKAKLRESKARDQQRGKENPSGSQTHYFQRKLDGLNTVLDILEKTGDIPPDKAGAIGDLRDRVVNDVGEEKVKVFEAVLRNLIENIIALLNNFPGIGDKKDKAVGTDMCVFGILGPNNHTYGNTDCVLILKEDVMHHIDYFETICAATFYTNGRYRYTKESDHIKNIWFDRRPWMNDTTYEWYGFEVKPEARTDTRFIEANAQDPDFFAAKAQDPGSVKDKQPRNFAKETYYSEKYNRFHDPYSIWSYAVALEFILRTKNADPSIKSLSDVTLKDVTDLWFKNNSHSAIEAHLPTSFSLDYAERIIMKKDVYEELKKSDPKAADMLDELIKENGEDFLELIECRRCGECNPDKKCDSCNKSDHDKVVEAEFAFFEKRMKKACRPQMQGYSFGFSSENEAEFEYFIPASEDVDSAKVPLAGRISFAALGGGFEVILGNTGDYKSDAVDRDYYRIEIDSKNMELCCKSTGTKEVAKDSTFNAFCPCDDWIHYCIEINYAESSIVVKHSEQRHPFSKTECSFICKNEEDKKDIHKFQYVSFRFKSKCRPFIRDFKVEFNRAEI